MDHRAAQKEELREKRNALLEELKKLQVQKNDVERQLQLLAQQPPPAPAAAKSHHQKLPPPAAPAASGLKRPGPMPSASVDTRDTKRPKTVDRKAGVWGLCKAVISACKKHSDARWFNKPVDPVRDLAPDYYKVIKRPMDFGTIEGHLKSSKYTTPLQFRDDMRLVFNNCRLYNPILESVVRKACESLSTVFEREWRMKAVEAKWAEAIGEPAPAPELAGAPRREVSIDVVRDMGSQLHQTVSSLPSKTATGGPDRSRPMSFEEKRKLSVRIGGLPGEKLHPVVDIIHEGSSSQAAAGEEIELDIDQLDQRTLWRLWDYVDGVVNGKAQGGGGGDRTGGGGKPSASGKAGGVGSGGGREHSSKPQSNGPSRGEGGKGGASQGNGGPAKPAASTSSGSSSSGGSSSSSSSDDDSDDEQASAGGEKVESTFGNPSEMPKQPASLAGGGEGYDMSALVSSTARKDQSTILKNLGAKKDVKFKNIDEWTAAMKQPQANGKANGAAAAEGGTGPGAAAGGAGGEDDKLWTQFESLQDSMNKRKQEQQQEEERLKEEKEKAERAKREEADKAAKEAAEAKKKEEDAKDGVKENQQLGSQLEFMRSMGALQALDNKESKLPGLTLKEDDEDVAADDLDF